MKVILQENVEGLGYLGDVLTVAKGYARNYLLPRKKAVVAEERQVKLLQHIKRQTDQKVKKELEALGEDGKKLSKISLTFEVQTGKDNKMFGSVTSKDVAEKLAAQGVEVDRKKDSITPFPQGVGNIFGCGQIASRRCSEDQCHPGQKGWGRGCSRRPCSSRADR